MKQISARGFGSTAETRARQRARVQVVVLALAAFVAGIVVSVAWLRHQASAGPANPEIEPSASEVGPLSEGTETVLKPLASAVQIRYYAILDPASASDTLRAFANRVDHLLSAYEQAGNGMIKVTRFTSPGDVSTAAADGIRGFDLDKGEGCYLGIAVACAGRKESLGRLLPQWESALEADLSRAIERVSRPLPASQPLAAAIPVDTNAIAQVRRAIPNLANISIEQGTEMLRAAALTEFKAAITETQGQLKEAQQQLAEAQTTKPPAEQQAAMKQLQDIQAEQAERLKQIGARLQAQIAALQHLKQQ